MPRYDGTIVRTRTRTFTCTLQAQDAEAAKTALRRILDKSLGDSGDLPWKGMDIEEEDFYLQVDAHVRPERRTP